MDKGELVNECKKVGIKGCSKRMKEETLIIRQETSQETSQETGCKRTEMWHEDL